MNEQYSTYLVGSAVRDITPPVGIRMCGFAHRTEPSTDVYHPLQAAAVAVDDGKHGVMIIGADLLGFYDRTETVRQAVSAAIGLPEEAIVLAGSHTHCGPHIRDFDIPRLGPVNTHYLQMLTKALAEAAREAWEKRRRARLYTGVGTCKFSVCRRRLRADGMVEWGPYPEGISDHDVPVIVARDQSGEPVAVLYSYACHPTSRAGTLIGGDFVSFAHDRLAAAFPGTHPCFLQGCGADQKPRPAEPDATSFEQKTVSQVRTLGSQLADAVIETINHGDLTRVSGAVDIRRSIIQLESVPPDAEDAQAVLQGSDQRLHPWARRILKAVEEGATLNRHAPFEIQSIAFGSALVILTLSGEMTVEHGLRLKRDLAGPFEHILVAAYTNHIVGYVPVERQIPEGGYCVEWANKFHGRTGRWLSGTEEKIHSTIHDMLGVSPPKTVF